MSAENPYDTACCLNKYYHLYLTRFLWRSYKKEIIPYEDYYKTPKVELVDSLYPSFIKCFNKCKSHKNSVKKSSWKFSKRLLVSACILLFAESCLSAVNAFFLGEILQKISDLDERYDHEETVAVWIYTGGLVLVTILFMFIHPISYFLMFQASYRLRIVLNVLIYDKVLRLKSYMLNQTSSGEILNMVSIDLGKFDFVGMFLTFFLVSPFYFLGKAICSFFIVGWPGVVGCCLFLILIPIQLSFTRLFARYRVKSAHVADERVKLMREIIDGIRVIKMYVWEESFAQVIRRLRSTEVKELVKMHVLNGINYGINAGAPQFVVMTTILITLYVQDKHLLPNTLFAYITLMVDVRYYAQMFTLALPYLAEVRIAFDRIQRLIDISEDPNFYIEQVKEIRDELSYEKSNQRSMFTKSIKVDESSSSTGASFSDDEHLQKGSVYVKLKNVTAVHDTTQSNTNTGFSLTNVNFTATPGDLVVVVGPSGSGKSSLLTCILDEMVVVMGEKEVEGSIAYASQEAWIMAGNLRDNIIFGRKEYEKMYQEVVVACSLTRDFEIMQDGDQTMVGERGAGLSGGQKARVGLARAVYRDADIVLLDDPLSAVDNHVSKQLFELCIKDYLKSKVVILATHQMQYLPQATKVVLLHEGEMLGCGSLEELHARGFDVGDLMLTDEQKAATTCHEVPLETIMDVARVGGGTELNADDSYAMMRPFDEETFEYTRSMSIIRTLSSKDSSSSQSQGQMWLPNIDVESIRNDLFGGRYSMKSMRRTTVNRKNTAKSSLTVINSLTSLPVFIGDIPMRGEDAPDHHVEEQEKKKAKKVKNDATVPQTPKQVGVEVEQVGNIKLSHYVHLFKMSGPIPGTLLIILLGVTAIACQITGDRFLTTWSQNNLRVETTKSLTDGSVPERQGKSGSVEQVIHMGPEEHDQEYMTIYITFVATFVFLNVVSSATFCVILAKASQRIHDFMFTRMLRVVTKFYDDHPSGQILNKFSKDVGIVDIDLNRAFFDFSRLAYMFIGYFIAISIVNVYVLCLSVPLLVAILVIRAIYLPGSRAIKRKEAVARSPVYTHISVTLANICSIHAYCQEELMMQQITRYIDIHTGFWFMFMAASRWFGSVIDMVVALFQSGTILLGVSFCMYGIDNFGPSSLGFMLYYTFALLVICQYMLRQSCEVDILMTSVERIRDYYDLPIEYDGDDVVNPDPKWPESGRIELNAVSLKYDAEDGTSKYALRDLTITILHGEKIGICGRTGAGKSSLIVLLTRLFEVSEGQILIDGIDCAKIPMSRLRRSISIIPQDPVLFSRTVRDNLDPFGNYSNEVIRDALERVEMLEPLERLPYGLYTMVAEGGSNFSVGQRQLLCLARALISETKVLLVDEATANVDFATDQLIQKTLKEVFANATVLTIAHRLNTILDSSRVIVLDAGQIVEFGTPEELRAKPDGFFHNLLQQREDVL